MDRRRNLHSVHVSEDKDDDDDDMMLLKKYIFVWSLIDRMEFV